MPRIKVLLVEDDQEHQKQFRCALLGAKRDVQVTVAGTGAQALDEITARRFDCALVEYRLPDCTADALLKHAASHLHGCPVLVVSSAAAQRIAIDSLRSGAADFLTMSEATDSQTLWRRVSLAIAKNRRRHADRRLGIRRRRQLVHLAETDPLTGLFNRRHLKRLLHADRRRARHGQTACIMLDIDHFKQINDRYGHSVGDTVLRVIAMHLRAICDRASVIMRWGGEEFLILGPSSGPVESWLWAEGFRQAIEGVMLDLGPARVNVTASIGVVTAQSAQVKSALIHAADRAMYLAKRRGRNNVGTDRMVSVDDSLTRLEFRYDLSPEQRRIEFINDQRPHVGSTQLTLLTEHSEAVAALASQLAQAMLLQPGEVDHVCRAGLFHNIGACVIPEELLAHPAALAPEEEALVARQAVDGAWIAARLGLNGSTPSPDAKTPGADIVAAADAVVTAIRRDEHQTVFLPNEVLREVQQRRGVPLDPTVVRAVRQITPSLLQRVVSAGQRLAA